MNTRILGVSASLRGKSYSRIAVQHVLEAAVQQGAEVRFLDLRELNLPLFNPDQRESESAEKIKSHVLWANTYLLGTPDYHGTMSGSMKNFLDYFWKEFAGKLFGYICASHEKGLTAMDQMRTSTRQCYGWSLPYGISVSDEDFDAGKVKNPRLIRRLNILAHDLNVYGHLLSDQFNKDRDSGLPDSGFASHYR